MEKIKKIIILSMIIVFMEYYLASYGNNDDMRYKTYKNERYGFSINYPDFLVEDIPPANKDGMLFKNKDDTLELIVFGYNNIGNKSLKEIYYGEISLVENIKYKTMGDNWYIVSWEEDGYIYYKKVVFGEKSTNVISYRYPNDKKEFFDEIIKESIKSFKTPYIDQYN